MKKQTTVASEREERLERQKYYAERWELMRRDFPRPEQWEDLPFGELERRMSRYPLIGQPLPPFWSKAAKQRHNSDERHKDKAFASSASPPPVLDPEPGQGPAKGGHGGVEVCACGKRIWRSRPCPWCHREPSPDRGSPVPEGSVWHNGP